MLAGSVASWMRSDCRLWNVDGKPAAWLLSGRLTCGSRGAVGWVAVPVIELRFPVELPDENLFILLPALVRGRRPSGLGQLSPAIGLSQPN